MPEVKNQLAALGFEVPRTSHKKFANFVLKQTTLWKEAVELSGHGSTDALSFTRRIAALGRIHRGRADVSLHCTGTAGTSGRSE